MTIPAPVVLEDQTVSAATSVTIVTGASISVGDTVMVALEFSGTTTPTGLTVTDASSNTYAADYALDDETLTVFSSQATAAMASGGGITASWTGSANVVAVAFKVAAAVTVSGSPAVTDVTSSTSHPATVAETGGDLTIVIDAAFGAENTGTPTSDAPFTLINYSKAGSPTNRGILAAYHLPSSSGSSNFDGHWGIAHSGRVVALTYAPAGGPSTTALAGVRGATAAGFARFGSLSTSDATILNLSGKRSAHTAAVGRLGQFSLEYLRSGGAAWAESRFGSLDAAAALTALAGAKSAAGFAGARFGTLATNTRGNQRINGTKTASAQGFSRPGRFSLNAETIQPVLTVYGSAVSRFGSLLLHNRTPGQVTIRTDNRGLVTVRIGN